MSKSLGKYHPPERSLGARVKGEVIRSGSSPGPLPRSADWTDKLIEPIRNRSTRV